MTATVRLWTLFCLVAALSLTFSPPTVAQGESEDASGAPEFRTFTDYKGRKAELAVVAVDEDEVTLKRKDGRTLKLYVSKFSEPDQIYIKRWAASAVGVPPTLEKYGGKPFEYWSAKFTNIDGDIDYTTWESMSKFGPKGVPVLVKMLGSKNDDNRSRAARELGNLRAHAKPAIPNLVGMLGEEGYGPRDGAIEALADIGEVAVPAVYRALQSEDDRVRAGAAEALKTPTKHDPKILPRLIELLEDEEYSVRSSVINSLAAKGAMAVPALLETLESDNESAAAGAASALRTKTALDLDRTIPALLKALENTENYSLRSSAGYSLANKLPEGAPLIIAALKHEDPRVRQSLVSALGHEEASNEVIDVLINVFTDSNQEVREAAAYAISEAGTNSLPPLLKALKSEDWRFREGAANALRHHSYYGDMEKKAKELDVESVLMDSLKNDEDLAVRTQAAAALGSIESKKGVGLLLGALQQSAPGLREAAAESISEIVPPADVMVPVLVKLLDDPQDNIAQNAASTLAEYGPDAKAAVEDLIRVVNDASRGEHYVRNYSANALGQIGDESALPTLAKHAQDDANYLWSYCMSAIVEMAEDSDKALESLKELAKCDSERVASEANEGIERAMRARKNDYNYQRDKPTGFGTIELVELTPLPPEKMQFRGRTLTETMQTLGDADDENRDQAAKAVAQFGDAAVELLVPRLKSIDAAERGQAAAALQQLGPLAAPAVPALIGALGDDEWRVSSSARYALKNIGPAAIPAITKAAQEADEETRGRAIGLLGQEGASDETIALLISYLDNETYSDYATGALASCGSRAVPALQETLKSEDEQLRVKTMYALARMYSRARGATDDLIARLQTDDSDEVRAYAAEALGNIRSKSALPALKTAAGSDKVAQVRANSLEALGNLDLDETEMIPLLVVGLQDEDGNVISQAAQIIRNFEDGEVAKAVVPFLAATLKDTEKKGSWRREYAAEALGKIKDPAAIDALVAVLGDDSEYIRRYAVVALGEIGGAAQKAIPAIRKLADDEDEDVREAVKKALKQIQMPG